MIDMIRERAAQLVEEHGWCQHSYRGSNGEICGLTAVYDAAQELDPMLSASTGMEVQRVISRELGISGLSQWNDVPGRTQAEVVAALRGEHR